MNEWWLPSWLNIHDMLYRYTGESEYIPICVGSQDLTREIPWEIRSWGEMFYNFDSKPHVDMCRTSGVVYSWSWGVTPMYLKTPPFGILWRDRTFITCIGAPVLYILDYLFFFLSLKPKHDDSLMSQPLQIYSLGENILEDHWSDNYLIKPKIRVPNWTNSKPSKLHGLL